MFAVDVLPVSLTDFPLTMVNREEAIDRYALENGIVSRMQRGGLRLVANAGTSEEIVNGWMLRHRVFEGSTGGPDTYDLGKIYQTRVPVTVGLTTVLVSDHVVLLTQYTRPTNAAMYQRDIDTFADIRRTMTFTLVKRPN